MLNRNLTSQLRFCKIRASQKWGWGNNRVLGRAVDVAEEFGINKVKHAVKQFKKIQKKKRRKPSTMERKQVAFSNPELWPITLGKSVAYCTDYVEADELIGHYIFDAEPRPEVVSMKTDRRVTRYQSNPHLSKDRQHLVANISVLTIATAKVVLVLHLSQFQEQWKSGISSDDEDDVKMPFLRRLIASTDVIKATTAVAQLCHFLKSNFGFTVGGFVDVSILAKHLLSDAQCNGVKYQPTGFYLQELASAALQKPFPYPLRQVMSNWDVLPLSEDQIVFASNNAYALILVYNHIVKVRSAMQASSYGPWYPVYVSINSLILPFPKTDLGEIYEKGSEFHTDITQLLQKTFRGYRIHAVWFSCFDQTVGIALDSQEKAQELINEFSKNLSIIVTDVPREWKDLKEEFRLRLAGSR